MAKKKIFMACGMKMPTDKELLENISKIAKHVADTGWTIANGGGYTGIMGYVVEEFAKYCAERMNIDEAILKVEEKTKSKIHQEYKEFVRASFDQRFRALCDCLDLDYYKLMDEKYYEYEMEEK